MPIGTKGIPKKKAAPPLTQKQIDEALEINAQTMRLTREEFLRNQALESRGRKKK